MSLINNGWQCTRKKILNSIKCRNNNGDKVRMGLFSSEIEQPANKYFDKIADVVVYGFYGTYSFV